MIGETYIDRPQGIANGDLWRIVKMSPFIEELALADIPKGWAKFKREYCKGLAPATIDRFRTTLVAALSYGCKELEVPAPQIPGITYNNKRIRWLSMDEQDRLLAAYAPHVQPIALTLCFQGCRTHEALELDWRHVDLGAETIHFAKTKTDHPRSVPIHARVKEALLKIYVDRHQPIGGRVFLNRLGNPYSDWRTYKIPGSNPIRKAHATACKRASIEDFTPHDWRHHFASWAVMRGIDLKTLMDLCGWTSFEMVNRYAALSTDHMREALGKMR